MKIFILRHDKEVIERAAEIFKSNLCSQINFTNDEKEVLLNIFLILRINVITNQNEI